MWTMRARLVLLVAVLAMAVGLLPPEPVASAAMVRSTAPQPCAALRAGIDNAWTGRVGPGVTSCVRLAYPSGSEVLAVSRLGFGRGVDLTYVDAAGEVQCRRRANDFPSTRACELAGQAPYRVLATNARRTPFALAIARLDSAAGCSSLPEGTWGTSKGATVRLDRGDFATCLSVPREDWGAGRILEAFERRAGSGRATLVARGHRATPCVIGSKRVRALQLCEEGSRSWERVTLVMATTGAASRWRVVRHRLAPEREDAEGLAGCEVPASTELGGPVTPGRLDHFTQLDCYLVDADLDDELALGVHGRGTALRVFNGQSTACRERSAGLCQVTWRSWYALIVHGGGGSATPGRYQLEPWLVRTADGPVPGCVASTAPVEQIGGSLDAEHPAVCLRAPRSLQYDVSVLEGGAMPWAAQIGTALGLAPYCEVLGGTRMQCSDWGDTAPADRLLVFGRPDGVGSLEFVARGEITAPSSRDVPDRP
jgi:hypothetical protein